MSNTLSLSWVKNVYSLRIVGGIKGARLYTGLIEGTPLSLPSMYNLGFMRSFIPAFYAQLSTYLFQKIPPLVNSYTRNPQHLLLKEREKIKKGITIWSS